MGNIDSEGSKLKSYLTNDINMSFEYKPKSIFKSVMFSVLINNIFNEKYESNGYFYTYDDNWSSPTTITTIEGSGYYPQAGINGMLGLTLGF
jgi:iron complex outermembrane receptor protein